MEQKIQNTAENGEDQNGEDPRQLIRFLGALGNDVKRDEKTCKLQKVPNDVGNGAFIYYIVYDGEKLKSKDQNDKKSAAQKLAKPAFRYPGGFLHLFFTSCIFTMMHLIISPSYQKINLYYKMFRKYSQKIQKILEKSQKQY